MDKYTPEQVESLAAMVSKAPAVSMTGTSISVEVSHGVEVYKALRAYAERLRQDEKDAKDAARYRWLRENDGGSIYAITGDVDGVHPEQLDDAIDTAMKECP